MGWDSARSRQITAYQTRAPKRHGVDPDDLQHRWNIRTGETGLTPQQIRHTVSRADRPRPAPFTADDVTRFHVALTGADGVTRHRAVFDRRDVIQTVAGNRLDADHVTALADAWLTTPENHPAPTLR